MFIRNILIVFLFLFSFIKVNCYFYILVPKKLITDLKSLQNSQNSHNLPKLYSKKYCIDKWISYKKLLRTQNCFPVFLLNFLGGWLTMPSYKILLNKHFWIFSLITQLTMMNSMVINDLFDLKVDLINSNNRPLVKKQITIKEAQCLYISILIMIKMLTLYFFSNNYFYIYIYGINFLLFLYTPYLKNIVYKKYNVFFCCRFNNFDDI